METTHWADLAENFKIQDAACLMAGVPPAKAMVVWSDQLPPEARYVFERLWKAYMRGAGVYKQPELGSADFQKMLHGIDGNDFRTPTIVPARGAIRRQNMLIAPSAELMRKRLESVRVSREELHRWVKAMGIKSAYSFAPVAEIDTAPEQEAPTPKETIEQRRARYLAWHNEEQRINPRGALQRVYEREAKQNPKADRANIGKDIKQAQGTARTQKQAGAMFGQLVRDGKRQN